MSGSIQDNCNNCNQDYEFSEERDFIVVYLVDSTEYNHINATCPNCGFITRILIDPDAILYVLNDISLPIQFCTTVHDEIAAARHEIDGTIPVIEPEADDAYIPREWLRQLWDDMREFGGES